MSSTAIAPAAISPRRPVPESIARPEYVDRPVPAPYTGNEVKDAETIAKMRVACRLAAQARDLVGEHVAPGVTTDELDRVGHEFLATPTRPSSPATSQRRPASSSTGHVSRWTARSRQ